MMASTPTIVTARKMLTRPCSPAREDLAADVVAVIADSGNGRAGR